MTNSIIGKKILFISPKYFGYETEIKKKLEEFGAIVDYYDERPSNSSIIKASIRINRRLISKIINNYYNGIIEKNRVVKYDYVFFIHVETPFCDILKRLRISNPEARYILYMWDSMLHRHNSLELSKYFDDVFTFDREDSIKYNFHFRPLFYLNEYSETVNINPEYDIIFIGTIHSDRYRIINEIRNQCKKMGLKSYWFLYMHNRLLFYKMKYSSINNLMADINDFSFKSLNKYDIIKLLQKSKVVVDIQHPENQGLTMRTLEVLALRKKLITTNNDVINYDIYNTNNIFIIKRNNPLIDKYFIESEYLPLQDDIYNRYSLDKWINDIFSN